MQSSQNTGVFEKKEAERIEFEISPNSNSFVFWKMNFKSGVCSSSSFPTEALVWIIEVDSTRNIDDSESFFLFFLGLKFPHFQVLDSKVAEKRRCTGTTGQSFLERKTNRFHDL